MTISLRDYFAGKAIEGAAIHNRLNDHNLGTRREQADRIAMTAYELADAMLRAQSPAATPNK